MDPKCIFCGDGCFQFEGEHHIVPKEVKNLMGWKGIKSNNLGLYKVPICRPCHVKLTELQRPLIYLIKHRTRQEIKSEEVVDLVKRIHDSFRSVVK